MSFACDCGCDCETLVVIDTDLCEDCFHGSHTYLSPADPPLGEYDGSEAL